MKMKIFNMKLVWSVFLLCMGALGARSEPLRIVSTAPNLTEMIYAVGAGSNLVGRSTACDIPPEVSRVTAIGGFGMPDLQKTLSVRPTHLFATKLADPNARDFFLRSGVAVIELPCERLADIPFALEEIGKWCGQRQNGLSLAQRLRADLKELRKQNSDGRKVLILLDSQQPFTVGKGTFISELMDFSGVRNLGDEDGRPYFQADLQAIMKMDPDLILCLFPTSGKPPIDFFKDRVGWGTLRAVKNQRVYAFSEQELQKITRPGPQIISGLRILKNLLATDLARQYQKQVSWKDTLSELKWARWITALLVGAALSMAGCVLQTLLRNPLADPYILGVSGGASLGAAVCMSLGWAMVFPAAIPLCSFVTAFLALFLVCRIAKGAGSGRSETLILSGVMLSAIESSLLLLVIIFSTPGELQQITWWMLGNLQATSWPLIIACGCCVGLGAILILLRGNVLNALLLGTPMANSLGVNAKREFFILLGAATLMTAASVSLAGIIGFVGLVIPHILRRLVGANHRRLLPLSMGCGAIFVWACDAIGMLFGKVGGIPVGVITALTGGPFFLFLLVSSARKRRGVC